MVGPEKVTRLRERFVDLHRRGLFVMPNPWDIGSAKILVSLGFAALATTSSGFAASLGRMDQRTTVEELAAHVGGLVDAVDVPVSVDAEHGYADTPEGVAANVERLAGEGAAGASIEDYDPATGILPVEVAAERVQAAAETAHRHGLVLTGRAENHLYGIDDPDDTIARLKSYREAGADVLYAPGLDDLDAIARLVAEVHAPVNALLRREGPTVQQLAEAGIRRVSTGGALAFAAYGALRRAAAEILASGSSMYMDDLLSLSERQNAFATTLDGDAVSDKL